MPPPVSSDAAGFSESVRSNESFRVAATLVALAEIALGRFAGGPGVAADRERLRRMGPERPGERERAGLGGWRGASREMRRDDRAVGTSARRFKPHWRDEPRRRDHRARLALAARIREKDALRALERWATNPKRTEEDFLPTLDRLRG